MQFDLRERLFNTGMGCGKNLVGDSKKITCWASNRNKLSFVFAPKTHAVSLSIGSACRSIFLQTLCCLVGSHRELYPGVHKRIINIISCFSIVFQRNYFIFFHIRRPPPPQTLPISSPEKNVVTAILN